MYHALIANPHIFYHRTDRIKPLFLKIWPLFGLFLEKTPKILGRRFVRLNLLHNQYNLELDNSDPVQTRREMIFCEYVENFKSAKTLGHEIANTQIEKRWGTQIANLQIDT